MIYTGVNMTKYWFCSLYYCKTHPYNIVQVSGTRLYNFQIFVIDIDIYLMNSPLLSQFKKLSDHQTLLFQFTFILENVCMLVKKKKKKLFM